MRQLLRITATFALALVFTAGMAFGQTNNKATVDQNSSGSQATITQTGKDNLVTGKGAKASSGVVQTNKSKAVVNQVGDDNQVSGLYQGGNPAIFNELSSGFNNVAEIDQKGDDNFFGNAKNSLTLQGSRSIGPAELDLDQIGDRHSTELNQRGRTDADIEQRNKGSGIPVGSGNTATVKQSDFSGNGTGTNLELLQVGLRNTSDITQGGRGPFTPTNNDAKIFVTGNGNEVDAEQLRSDNDLYLNMEDAAGTAGFDNGNTVDVDQTGGNGLIDGGIDGSFNTVTVKQSGFSNTVDGSVSGTGQADGLFIDGGNNTVTVTQSSDNNLTDVEVIGSNNSTTITQQSN
jgi:hypothetical protein